MDVAMLLQGSPAESAPGPSTSYTPVNGIALKRTASSSFEDMEDGSSRKKRKEDVGGHLEMQGTEKSVDGQALADELEQELQCGCCSALVYRPVVVSPCQHFFCGSCIVLWIKNGGTNCPACRGVSTTVTPSRPLQVIADVLVRASPSRARSVNERMQADEIYKAGMALRIPTPRQGSPEPNIPQSNPNFILPCPHCTPGNQYDWRCPDAIPDPEVDPDSAWRTDRGTPPGHGYCGNCESLLALRAPSTTRCDFCQVSFCGIGIPGRCLAAPIPSQHLHGLGDISDFIQCGEVYDIFDGNTFEVDVMFDYLQAQGLTPRHIYREIIGLILRTPRQFAPLIESDLFLDVHGVAGGTDPDPSAPRNRICRMCASEILLWGLREWWIQERKKGFLEASVTKRPDCPEGGTCSKQKDHAHAKEFNHIIAGPESSVPESIPAVLPEEDFLTRQAQRAFANGVSDLNALPLIIPVDEPDAPEDSNEVADEHLENAHGPDLPKEVSEPAPVMRQSSIFKLLSPDLPSHGTSAPANLANFQPETYPTTSQNTQDEIEAML